MWRRLWRLSAAWRICHRRIQLAWRLGAESWPVSAQCGVASYSAPKWRIFISNGVSAGGYLANNVNTIPTWRLAA
jgi:hypothetical protein